MTVVVSVKINDGIVLAGDSAGSFFDDDGNRLKIYNNANKVFNLVKGLPIGAFTWGVGGIGAASTATVTKDLRRRLSGDDPERQDWKLDRTNYTIQAVAERVREFFFEEMFPTAYGENPPAAYFLGYKVCGYSAGAALPELWDVRIVNGACEPPTLVRNQEAVGSSWDGEYEPMQRLLLGVSGKLVEILKEGGVAEDAAVRMLRDFQGKLEAPMVVPGMPIKDAIEQAIFMVETTIKYVGFCMGHETVGGPIEVASITKHEGFKWIQRKLFYRQELNP